MKKFSFLALFILIFIAGCFLGLTDSKTNNLTGGRLTIRHLSVYKIPGSATQKIKAGVEEYGLSRINVTITGPEGSVTTREFPYSAGRVESFPNLHFGLTRVEINGYDSTGELVLFGSTSVVVKPDITTTVDALTLLEGAAQKPDNYPLVGTSLVFWASSGKNNTRNDARN